MARVVAAGVSNNTLYGIAVRDSVFQAFKNQTGGPFADPESVATSIVGVAFPVR
jgi:hypothetical protein